MPTALGSAEKTAKRRVLFVEDEPGLRIAYGRFFAAHFEMAFAATGGEALTQLDSFRPEVVILDLRLPDTDGIDLLRKMRAVRRDLPVVITTSYASMEPMLELLGVRHSGYMVKPFDLHDLRKRIEEVEIGG